MKRKCGLRALGLTTVPDQERAVMDYWGAYGQFVDHAEFVLFMVAWCLLALDTVQQVRRAECKRKEKAQWRSSSHC